MTEMTDEELKQFLKDNKDRIMALVAEEMTSPRTEEVMKDRLHQIKDVASDVNDRVREKATETKDKVKGRASDAKDRTEEVMKDMYNAVMDPEVHRHFVKMGMEFFMGVKNILENAPLPKPVQKVKEDIDDSKSQVQPEICRNNPDCPLKKKKDDGLEKIELD